MPVAPAIIDLEEFTESINMCVYGDSGVGKTVFAGTAGRGLFLATEAGTLAARRQGSKAKLWKINRWPDLDDAYNWLFDNQDQFDWVLIDSVTYMQRLCMRYILEQGVAENKARDPDIPALQDWQKYYNMFDRFIALFNDLPINTLYTATTMRHEDENGDDIVLPELSGPSYAPIRESMKLCASVGIVSYIKVTPSKGDDETSSNMLFATNPPYFAKDRYDVFPKWVKMREGKRTLTTLATMTARIEASGNGLSKSKPAAVRKAPAKAVKAAPAKAAVKAPPVKARPLKRAQ